LFIFKITKALSVWMISRSVTEKMLINLKKEQMIFHSVGYFPV